MNIKTLAVVTSVFLASCAYGPMVSQNTISNKVTTAAEFDLNCSAESISIKELDSTSYSAMGCGKKARYVLNLCGSMNWEKVCTATLNGPVQEI